MTERGVEFKGGDGFGGSGKHLALFACHTKNSAKRRTVTVLAVSTVVAVSVVMATPLKPHPLFRHPDYDSSLLAASVLRK